METNSERVIGSEALAADTEAEGEALGSSEFGGAAETDGEVTEICWTLADAVPI